MVEKREVTLWEHLTELLTRLRIILISIFVSSAVASSFPVNFLEFIRSIRINFSISNPFNTISAKYTPLIVYVMNRLKQDLLPQGVELIAVKWTDVITVYATVALLIGVIFSSPIAAYEIYKFVNPALYPHERKFLYTFSIAFLLLFTVGVVYAYYVLVPISFFFMIKLTIIAGAKPLFSIADFYYFVSLALAGSGILFTFPIFIVLLVKYDVVSPDTLRAYWRHVIVGILVFAAIITPDPTPVTMSLISVPFIALYLGSVKVSEYVYKRSVKQ